MKRHLRTVLRTAGAALFTAVAVAASTLVGATPASAAPAGLPGMDVSSWQGNVNWQAAWNNGARFAYVKATEGTGYTSPYFAQQYNGSYNVGMIRGSYHFALPDRSSGAVQADYFVNHGGGWSKDGKTLPGALDIEYNPYGATCYGLSQASMRSWIASFVNQYYARTGRWATIYTTTDWWNTCTGNTSQFAANNPLWIARYSSSVGTLPAGWGTYSFWQWADSGVFPGDQNVWNGTIDRLKVLACNGNC
ncbi:lysozyme [Micromonospora sp. NPDC006766]|uniref:lysozyme n=1 Tax=Micromonospora sp. NPDC006766 TaxID=3154778 RepID=UPI0033FE59DE